MIVVSRLELRWRDLRSSHHVGSTWFVVSELVLIVDSPASPSAFFFSRFINRFLELFSIKWAILILYSAAFYLQQLTPTIGSFQRQQRGDPDGVGDEVEAKRRNPNGREFRSDE